MARQSLCLGLTGLLFLLQLIQVTYTVQGATDTPCYYPNGTIAISNVPEMPYLPCNPNNKVSMCCRTTTTDTCRSDGLCDSTWNNGVWRDFCTDPTWSSPNCIKLCIDGRGQNNQSVGITQCSDGSYCCGSDDAASECCSNGQGVWIDQGKTTDVKPTTKSSARHTAAATSKISSKTSNAIRTIKTTSHSTTTNGPTADGATHRTTTSATPAVTIVASTPAPKSSNNAGAIAGGVVGGIAAISIVAGALFYFLRRRRTGPMEEKIMPFVSHQPRMYNEMQGSEAATELSPSERVEIGTPESGPERRVHEMG